MGAQRLGLIGIWGDFSCYDRQKKQLKASRSFASSFTGMQGFFLKGVAVLDVECGLG
jgi:hypothetical protein